MAQSYLSLKAQLEITAGSYGGGQTSVDIFRLKYEALLETAPERAERVLREGLANWLTTQPERHPQTAMLLNALAKARYRRRDITEAVALNDRALDIARAAMGPQHPVVVMQMLDRADFLVAANRRKEAAALRKEANRIRTAKGLRGAEPPEYRYQRAERLALKI